MPQTTGAAIKKKKKKKNQEPTKNPQYAASETHFRVKDTHGLNTRGWKNIFHANGKDTKAWVAILISDKIDLRTTCIKKKRKSLYNDKGFSSKRIYYTC